MRSLVAFGRFWYDFIVGDSAVLAVGAVAALALGWLLTHAGDQTAAEIALPLIVIATLAASVAPLGRRPPDNRPP